MMLLHIGYQSRQFSSCVCPQ